MEVASAPDLLTLTDDDRALIARARLAFREDPEYLIEILWAARERHVETTAVRLPERPDEATLTTRQLVATLEALVPEVAPLESAIATRIEVDPSGCWVWTGALQRGHNPVLNARRGHQVAVRKMLYERVHGPCRSPLIGADCLPRCVHPDHSRARAGVARGDRLNEAAARMADTSDVGIQTMLQHRCTISRFAEVLEHGSPTRVWSVTAEGVPCLYDKGETLTDPSWTPEQRQAADQAGTLFTLPDADLQPGDRIRITRPPMARSFEVLPDPSEIPTLHTLSHREWHVRSVG